MPAVTIRELLRQTLRLRPDRIILGEVRGAEAFDLLQALNTGHSGTLSTIHANTARLALRRLRTRKAGRGWVRLHEKGGNEHEAPCHHKMKRCSMNISPGIEGEREGALFRTTGRNHRHAASHVAVGC